SVLAAAPRSAASISRKASRCCRCGAATVMPASICNRARPGAQQRLQPEPARIGLEADALQGADRIAEGEDVGALGAAGPQSAHDEEDGPGRIVAPGGLREVRQDPGLR